MGNIFIEYIDTSLPCFKCKQCDIVLFTRNAVVSSIINSGNVSKYYILNNCFNTYNEYNTRLSNININKKKYNCLPLNCRKCNCIVGYKIIKCNEEPLYNNCYLFYNLYIKNK